MTIQRTFNLAYGVLLLLALALATLAILLFVNQQRFEASEANRFRSFVLAEELRQTGEELTRFARAYVVTGNERFRTSFQEILAIRSGQAPRPVHYERIYWDYVAAGRTPPRGYGPPVPLLTLLKEAGITAPEFAKLAIAERRSDVLAHTEDVAMNARNGLYDDGTGRFTRRGKPDIALAIRLTHDQAYHEAIADVRTPIDEFFGMLDDRTAETVQEYSRRAGLYLYAILGVCALMIALKLAMFASAPRRIWTPVAALQAQVRGVGRDLQRLADVTGSIARGESDARFIVDAQPLRSVAGDEIGELMQQHNEMIHRLQDTGTAIATLTARQTARFDQLFDQAPEGIALLDAEDRVVRINNDFTQMFGYESHEAEGRRLNDLVVPPGVSDGASQTKVPSLRGVRERVSFDVVRRRKNGERFHVNVLGVPVDVASEEIKGLAIYRDITERKQAEEAHAALARLEVLRADVHVGLANGVNLQDMLQRSAQAIVDRVGAAFARIWLVDEREQILVLHASAGLYTRLDGSHSRVPVGELKIGLIAQEKKPHATNDVANDPRVSDKAWARQEGMVAFAGYPLLAGGRVVGVLALFSRAPLGPGTLDTIASIADTIAEGIQRRQAEQGLLEARAELAHVTRTTTMGEFAASLAHEVNQPLAAVMANASACRRWLSRKVPDLEEAQAALQRIKRDGKRASDVITGMRALLQRSPVEFTLLDLASVVRDVLELVGPEVVRQRVVLRRSLATDLPPIRGDRVQLQQVVLNLVMNAIQAMSSVDDRPRELRIGLSAGSLEEGPAQLVAVRDSGTGFREVEHMRMFESFYTTKPNGLGMGLAICRSILEFHRGRLWASANPDYGATFQFALPVEA